MTMPYVQSILDHRADLSLAAFQSSTCSVRDFQAVSFAELQFEPESSTFFILRPFSGFQNRKADILDRTRRTEHPFDNMLEITERLGQLHDAEQFFYQLL